METREDQVEQVIACVRTEHSYEVPKVLALRCDSVNEAYRRWVIDAVAPAAH